jgi:hypothetical protein
MSILAAQPLLILSGIVIIPLDPKRLRQVL